MRRSVSWLVVAVLLLCAGPASAQTQLLSKRSGGEARVMAGHSFLPSNLVVWPFVTTHFGTTTGFGLAKWQRTGQDDEGNTIEDSMTLGAFNEAFDLGIAFTDWLGIQARFGGNINAGANLTSALSVGAIFSAQTEGGLVLRLFQGGGFHLAIKAGAGYLNGKRLQPLEMLQVDENGGLSIQRSRLLTKVSGWDVGPTLMMAYAPAAWFGMQTSFTFNYGKLTFSDTTMENKNISWGAGVNFDARSIGFPLAIPVVYQLDRALEDDAKLEHRTESGFFYSGRDNLNLGLSMATKLGDEDKEYLGEFRMVYYW